LAVLLRQYIGINKPARYEFQTQENARRKTMKVKFCTDLSIRIALSLSLVLATPAPLFASTADNGNDVALTDQEVAQLRYDAQLAYWGSLKDQLPHVARFALDEELPEIWKITRPNSLLDQDPFFMRSQAWQDLPKEGLCHNEGFCFRKVNQQLQITSPELQKAFMLNAPVTPFLETSEHIFFQADSLQLFVDKVGESTADPGEGIFFVSKQDLKRMAEKNFPVPVFFFPLPGAGWSANNGSRLNASFEFDVTDQLVVYDKTGLGLPIEINDIAQIEKVSRQNLMLSQVFSFLDGQVDARGVALPKADSTLLFGLFLSGQTTHQADGRQSRVNLNTFSLLPQAFAKNDGPSIGKKIDAQIAKRAKDSEGEDGHMGSLKQWLMVGTLYGGMGAAAVAMYHPIDFSAMIQADMPKRIATVTAMLGAVFVGSVALKYSLHREHFAKLYPSNSTDSLARRVNQQHKGIMSEFASGLYFSAAVIPQTMRHTLAFLKDRFMPMNKMVSKAWEATMGFQMRMSSRLSMSYKTLYYGWIYGFMDAIQVFIYLTIFGPYILNSLDISSFGAATVAYASGEALRNFLSYAQNGAFIYSSEVKFIHLRAAEAEAKRRLQQELKGEDPTAPRYRPRLRQLTEEQLEIRYKAVGLPGKDEHLYDPISVLNGIASASGFSSSTAAQYYKPLQEAENAQAAAERRMPIQVAPHYILADGKQGLVQPALKKALAAAKEAQTKKPSKVGEQTVRLLEQALNQRSSVGRIAERTWDAMGSQWGREGLVESMERESTEYLARERQVTNTPLGRSVGWTKLVIGNYIAKLKGGFKYLALDGTKKSREIREVLFLMSTTGNANEQIQFLPESWRKMAESSEAARMGAELFHRAFFALNEQNINLITPSQAQLERYGEEANRELDQMARSGDYPELRDPFVREIRFSELVNRLDVQAKARAEALEVKPPPLTSLEQKKWNIVHAKAEALWKQAQNVTEGGEDAKWTVDYRFKVLVAREYAKKVGLWVSDLSESEFVPRVAEIAFRKTEIDLEDPKTARFYNQLPESEREFFEAQLFTRNFIDGYMQLAVNTDQFVRHDSPEFPGRFQRIRRSLATVPGGTVMNVVLRNFEALFRNDATAYQGTKMGWFNRNIPMIPDMFHNFARTLRVMPYALTFSFLTNYYIWQIPTPYALFAFAMLLSFLNPTLVEINNRVQRNNGMKPMGNIPSKLIYSWVHGFLTNPELIAIQGVAEPVQGAFERNIVEPIRDVGECVRNLVGAGGANAADLGAGAGAGAGQRAPAH